VSGELSVQIEGVPKFKAFYGVNHGNIAVQLTRAIETD
jgi:flagellar motor switch protein FliM